MVIGLTSRLGSHQAEAGIMECKQMLFIIDAVSSNQVVEWASLSCSLPVLLAVPVQLLHCHFSNSASPWTICSQHCA